MTTLQKLTEVVPVQNRLPWMVRDADKILGARIEGGDLAAAAATLDKFAEAKGLRIEEVARFKMDHRDVAFARLA